MSVSSRVLRKIRGDQDALSKGQNSESEEEDHPHSSQPRASMHINRYNLLNEGSQSESEVKEDDNDGEEEQQGNCCSAAAGDGTSNHDLRISKRKKKKKKRKAISIMTQTHSSEDLDEVERSVKEVNALLGVSTVAPTAVMTHSTTVIERGSLALDRKHLNAKNELRRIFGSEAVQAEEPSKRGRKRGLQKHKWLVASRPEWVEQMKQGPTLTMTLVSSSDGVQLFKFEHSSNYQVVERKFLASVESMDPMQLMMLTNQHPFHVNTLIQLCEICNMNEEYQSAAQLVERALFALESAFHPHFNLSKGNCRLDYRHQENRALFIALFSHLRFVGLRACYRTALELAKLLLSLSPIDDPLAVVLCVDWYAIRSGEYKWLLELVEEFDGVRRLSQLPSIALGMALAHFHLGHEEAADKQLQHSLIMFPGVLLPLLDKCSVAPDAKTLASYFFVNAEKKQSAALKQLVELYVGRSYHLWKESSVLRWLERNTHAVLERVDRSDPLIADYAAKRAKRFECTTPRPVQRHVLLSDIPDVSLTETGTTYNFDPLPPVDTIDIYRKPSNSRTERVSHLDNTFSLFFRSLLPAFNTERAVAADPLPQHQPDDRDHVPEEAGLAGAGAGAAAMRRSLHTMMDALRDLMNVIPDPGPGRNDVDGDGDAGAESTATDHSDSVEDPPQPGNRNTPH